MVYSLAALSKHGIISLDPSKPFMDVERVNGEYHIESESPEGYIEQMLSLWDSLGRPQLNNYDWFERTYKAVFSPLRDEFHLQYLLKEEGNLVGGCCFTWGGIYYGLHPHKDTAYILRSEHRFPEKAFCKLDTTSLMIYH